jgi:hypothetical protein
MPPLALSDAELDAIMTACLPIPVERRDAFVHAVAEALANGGETVGPGSVHRAIVATQRRLFDPPDLGSGHMPIGVRKYG